VDDKAPIQQSVHYGPVRRFDSDGDRAACNRENPVAKPCQAPAAMREFTLSCDAAPSIKNANLMLFSSPIDTCKPTIAVFCSIVLPLDTYEPLTTPAIPVLALGGATSYRTSVVASPPGHMSGSGAQGTGDLWQLPASRPAR
jgi:hypothetical protein